MSLSDALNELPENHVKINIEDAGNSEDGGIQDDFIQFKLNETKNGTFN